MLYIDIRVCVWVYVLVFSYVFGRLNEVMCLVGSYVFGRLNEVMCLVGSYVFGRLNEVNNKSIS